MHSAPNVLFLQSPAANARPLRERLATLGLNLTEQELAAAAHEPVLATPDIAVLAIGDESSELDQITALVERFVAQKVATLVWGPAQPIRWAGGPLVDWIDPNTSVDEVAGRLGTMCHYVPLVKRFERELAHLHRLGEQLNRYFSEIDQEMRLAGRLQRDFLPRTMPDLPGYTFDALYRPASWVSGDMYDLFRIDETHLGIFLADAMGHGVAAGLLTMFLRQALVPKRINGSAYEIVSPAEALGELHGCLVRQQLPNCQFITAIYGVLNTETHELRLSRAGHPYPIHTTADGRLGRIEIGGGLLGLPDIDPDFEERVLTMVPGEKILLFSDGIEDDLFDEPEDRNAQPPPAARLTRWAQLSIGEMVEAIRLFLETKEGSLHPADDITVVGFERASG